ncbi:hypothetical protein HYALB_00004423 [Hymenoscyphus albidus]|uniref:DUF676 domain-containing protein n=1 Tax=Hymenoscyphus albidus TaxID=595503 RepID=A0A9N9LH69_9HELO|nr:hypothetical protein HYALB_00004423 [Hymenoscyphus albidus]
MATQAQLDEKARAKAEAPQPSVYTAATPAQIAEKGRRDPLEDMATQAQLDEKRRNEMSSAYPSQFHNHATPAQLAEKAGHPRASVEHMATHAQLEEKRLNALGGSFPSVPPPPPPRTSQLQPFHATPPAYNANDAKRSKMISEQWRSHDPRSSSTHSLVPLESTRDGRRTLLLVFIHGFMGNETSFQSFPAHIHNLLTITMAETHIVHTKIYPRYESRRAINFASDDFSKWLEPHENDATEVVLLGHSMGGILSAEVVLQRPFPPIDGRPLRHRLLGTINFDTPFLGMHPGVVGAGLSSLFRPADPPAAKSPPASTSGANSPSMSSQASINSSFQGHTPSIAGSYSSSQMSLVQSITSPGVNAPSNDPFFNAPFPNDVRLPERKGISSLLHFINKHSDGLTGATKDYFMSHIEFGGVMADYTGLKIRYENLRKLEDVDDITRRPGQTGSQNMRVRFVNYYTASTGRPKPPKLSPTPSVEVLEDEAKTLQNLKDGLNGLGLNPIEHDSSQKAPTILVEEHGDGAVTPRPLEANVETPDMFPIRAQIQNLGENSGVQENSVELTEMQHIDSMPIPDDDLEEPVAPSNEVSDSPVQEVKSEGFEPPLPPIPHIPIEPEPINLDLYTDKDSRKIAEKEFKRVTKVYQQAIKDRESAIKDRRKLVEKREKKARQEREKVQKAEEKQRLKKEKEEQKRLATVNPEKAPERKAPATPLAVDDKPMRDRKFCILPPKYGGERDECWVRVYMEGVDEVGAHCGLFFPGPQYESLVGDVGARIGKWVEEDATRRAILDAEMAD